MACLELDIGGMAGNSQSRASCGRRLLFREETIELPVLSLLPPPSPPPVLIWVLNELGERFMEHHVRDYVNCLVLNLWKKN